MPRKISVNEAAITMREIKLGRDRLRGVLMQELGICDATDFLVSSVIEEREMMAYHARKADVCANTFASRWHRLKLPSINLIRAVSSRFLLAKCVRAGASFQAAAYAVGHSSPQSAHRNIRLYWPEAGSQGASATLLSETEDESLERFAVIIRNNAENLKRFRTTWRIRKGTSPEELCAERIAILESKLDKERAKLAQWRRKRLRIA